MRGVTRGGPEEPQSRPSYQGVSPYIVGRTGEEPRGGLWCLDDEEPRPGGASGERVKCNATVLLFPSLSSCSSSPSTEEETGSYRVPS